MCECGRLLDRAAAERPAVVLIDWHLGEAASTEAVAGLQCGGRDSAPARTTGAAAYATVGDRPDSLLAVLAEVAPESL